MAAKRKRKPGASIPDAERHTVKRTLRLTPDESAVLDAVAEARVVNVSRAVGALALEACAPRKRGGPTWAQFAAWCSRHGFDAADARRNIEQHEAQLEADRWMVAIRSLAAAGPHLTGTAWMENQRAVDIAMRAHERAVRRAYG